MTQKLIVFDFDKTLSYKDSLVEIFKSEMVGYKCFFKILYFFIQVLAKIHLISRTFEKEYMIKILFHNNEAKFINACYSYADKRDLNPIYQIFLRYTKSDAKVILLSASSQYFLEYMLRDISNVQIVGTTFVVKNGIIKRIDRHPSGNNKRKIMDEMGISLIDECYYDSKSDECLLPISKSYFKIKNGKIVESNV